MSKYIVTMFLYVLSSFPKDTLAVTVHLWINGGIKSFGSHAKAADKV